MNTEQLKTDKAKEILNHHYVHDKGFSDDGTKGWVINAMQDFASQESKRAVDEFKEKLTTNILSIGECKDIVARRHSYTNWSQMESALNGQYSIVKKERLLIAETIYKYQESVLNTLIDKL